MDPENKIKPVDNTNDNVETFAEDMARVIEGNTEEGLIKRIIHEEEEKEIEKRNLSLKSRKNQVFLSISVLLLLAALGTIFFISTFRKEIETVPIVKEVAPIIFLDRSSYLDISGLSKEKIAQTILNEAEAADIKGGEIEGAYLMVDKRVLGLREFITTIKGGLNITENEFINDKFLIGVTHQTEKNIFVLLQGRAFADIFPVMRAWEEKMFFDLSQIFGHGTISSTSYLLSKDFEDTIVENKNARVLYDNNKVPLLMYVFANDNSVVITKNHEAVRVVKERLAAGEIKK